MPLADRIQDHIHRTFGRATILISSWRKWVHIARLGRSSLRQASDDRFDVHYAVATGITLISTAFLLGWMAIKNSPTELEVAQLPSGLYHLQTGRFEPCIVNPPLVRMIAACPLLFGSPDTDWRSISTVPSHRSERSIGTAFVEVNGAGAFRYFILARWACIPITIVGGWVCSQWAKKLYGTASGLVATLLWCLSPFILGHASLMTADAHSAALGVVAWYCFWRWLQKPGIRWTTGCGIALGIAQLSKFTLLILYPLAFIALMISLVARGAPTGFSRSKQAGMFVVMLIVSIWIINVGYGFDGSLTRLGDFVFQSSALASDLPVSDQGLRNGNIFRGTALAPIWIPFPKYYVLGIDLQKWDIDRGLQSYLQGEWKQEGWWYFYLYGLIVKSPIGTVTLFGMAICVSVVNRRYICNVMDECVLLLPSIAIIGLVSAQTGYTHHIRYVIPALPFIFIWTSKLFCSFKLGDVVVASFSCIALMSAVACSILMCPHSISYFNAFAGGPTNGYRHLVDSNIGCGQDLFYLARWIEQHPEVAPLYLASFGPIDPRLAGILFRVPPVGPSERISIATSSDGLGPVPGWFAIDVNFIAGSNAPIHDARGKRQYVVFGDLGFRYFRHFTPVARAGYSINIYHITLDSANNVRRQLGMNELVRPSGCTQETLQD